MRLRVPSGRGRIHLSLPEPERDCLAEALNDVHLRKSANNSACCAVYLPHYTSGWVGDRDLSRVLAGCGRGETKNEVKCAAWAERRKSRSRGAVSAFWQRIGTARKPKPRTRALVEYRLRFQSTHELLRIRKQYPHRHQLHPLVRQALTYSTSQVWQPSRPSLAVAQTAGS